MAQYLQKKKNNILIDVAAESLFKTQTIQPQGAIRKEQFFFQFQGLNFSVIWYFPGSKFDLNQSL